MNKVNDCLNKVILVGPFAHGIDRHIRENAEDYGVDGLPGLIRQKLNKNIEVIDLPTTSRLTKLYNLDIICNPDINFQDNTFAGDVLLDDKLRFTPNRGSWFSIPLETLQKKYCDEDKLNEARYNNDRTAVINKLGKYEGDDDPYAGLTEEKETV